MKLKVVRLSVFALTLCSRLASAAGTEGEVRLGGAMETPFRACALQVTQRTYLTQASKAELGKVSITPGGLPPADYRTAIAQDKFGTPLFAKMDTPDAVVWLMAYADAPVCKVVVGDTLMTWVRDLISNADFERRLRGPRTRHRHPTARFWFSFSHSMLRGPALT